MNARYKRQSFLGRHSQAIFENCVVGIVGLGGGGSIIVQQLAHIGFLNYVLYDNDIIEDTNLNRLVGATTQDVKHKRSKMIIAKRTIQRLQPTAHINANNSRWQDNPYPLRNCDIVFGCVDGFAERRDLEVCTRRYLIPYIDIGIDVNHIEPEPPVLGGQVILSMPGELCLSCVGFLTEERLEKEAAKYGDAGDKPQVIWANGIVASTAIGIAIEILTGWTKVKEKIYYLSYDAAKGTMQPHVRLAYLGHRKGCIHFPLNQLGDPILKTL